MNSNDKIKCQTLSNLVSAEDRQIGNTTRQIDYAIQLLFDDYIVVVRDHYENGTNKKENICLFDKILDRIKLEHKYLFQDKKLRANKNTLEIEII